MSTHIKVDINRNVGLSMALAVSGGFLAGYYVSRILSTSSKSVLPDASSEMDSPHTNGSSNSDAQRFDAHYAQKENSGSAGNASLEEIGEESLVLALLVRLDLQLSAGTTAKHCSTASLGQFKKLYKIKSAELRQWELTNGRKVCLGVNEEAEMLGIQAAARSKGIPTRTVIDERSRKVVLALGPAPMRELNLLLSDLKELSVLPKTDALSLEVMLQYHGGKKAAHTLRAAHLVIEKWAIFADSEFTEFTAAVFCCRWLRKGLSNVM